MSKLIDIKGQKFNYLTVLDKNPIPSKYKTHKEMEWICQCDCENQRIVRSSDIRKGKTKSCGCKQHLGTHLKTNTPEYRIYKGMIQRCYNSNKTEYYYYGGRGITVCEEWLSKTNGFETFLKDMGERPDPSYSLDRIDSSKNYCKENCRWATPDEQWENRKQISLSIRKYQFETDKTAIYPKEDKLWAISYCLLGIASESGELCGKYKKMIRDNGFELSASVKKSLIDEAGDLAWYLSQLCTELNVSMEYVFKNNLSKLTSRKERGVIHGSGDNR